MGWKDCDYNKRSDQLTRLIFIYEFRAGAKVISLKINNSYPKVRDTENGYVIAGRNGKKEIRLNWY